MEFRRFLGKVVAGAIVLDGEEFYHSTKVLRLKIKDNFYAITGDGYDYFCQIKEIYDSKLIATILEKKENLLESRNKIVLCVAICKELEFILQKSIELGVSEIIPFISSRTNIKTIRRQRLEKIAIDAIKQTGRATIPQILDPVAFIDLLKKHQQFGNRIVCYEKQEQNPFSSMLNWVNRDTMVIIGSEGGFDEQEIIEAKQAGFKIASLGTRVLRVETAAISSLVLIHNKYGSM